MEFFKKDFFILAILWIVWCTMHSFLISISVTNFMKSRLGNTYRFYRLFFNIISTLALIPVLAYSYTIESDILFRWDGVYRIFQALLVVISLYFFYTGAKHYDGLHFLGLRQFREDNSKKVLSGCAKLDSNGVLCLTRHPWYLGSILIIWARTIDVQALIVNVILTLYLIIGTYLEERKLVIEFGDQYRKYQKKVSMLFPFKWIIALVTKR